MHVLFVTITLLQLGNSLCPETNACIERIRRLVAEPRRFWFGEQWKEICTGRHRNVIDCYNPHALQPFHTLGSRLFRVKTYQAAFLQHLRIFPRVTYRARPGRSYRACDHDFVVDEPQIPIIEADPDMDAVEPFSIRYLPDIRWQGMTRNDTYIILMVDAGFGMLNYLAYDYPRNAKVLRHYVPSENFRPLTNPLVVIVFQQNARRSYDDLKMHSDSELFHLPQFMMDNALENDLIGMNVVLVSTDAYSIEKQRMRAVVDNCHSLVEQKLRKDNRWPFVASFPLSEMDSWLSVDYRQPAVSYKVCCEQIDLWEMWLALDPLGDGNLPSLVVLNEPRVSAMRIPQNNANYQRSTRDFIGVVLFDYSYTLVLFDPDRSYLYWLVIDIPSASLAAASIADGKTIVPYLPPVPAIARSCSMLIFMLFTQTHFDSISFISEYFGIDHALRTNACIGNCSQRSHFDIEHFKSLHQLRLSAVNWMRICYDIHEAQRHIQFLTHNMSVEESHTNLSVSYKRSATSSHIPHKNTEQREQKRERRLSPEEQICPLMKTPAELLCDASSTNSYPNHLLVAVCCIVTLTLMTSKHLRAIA
ncbi:Uncharacterized protein C56G2.4 [Toxocara canis]|uniref:Uncharacterized protein C56G2.4 n=1 Tax=Toxocara canis TaxID=6265 RepID=A0A0B2VZI9_TOXCA|nr:Uncharacterized protein C56G2.4 [Toxocara canis]